jgi:hypothetical protein
MNTSFNYKNDILYDENIKYDEILSNSEEYVASKGTPKMFILSSLLFDKFVINGSFER